MFRPAAALVGTALLCADVYAQEPSTATVLARIASYVSDYQKQLIGVVAEEHYRQNAITTSRGGRQSRQFRELKSDLLLVQLPEESGTPNARTLRVGVQEHWLQFRDVFEVDRKPVRDRDQCLYKLFVTPTRDARDLAETIQQESSRHNIGPVSRTINMPILIANIQVTYGTAPGFTLLLPSEMREVYRVRVNESRIDSRATYHKFRQFTVTTTEKTKPQ